MKIKRRPGEFTPHQWANDWITVRETGRVVSPASVQLTTDEDFERFRATQDDMRVGQFWLWWELHPDGTFTPTDANPKKARLR